MSDAHANHDGGHEIDNVPAGRLFRILGALSVVTLSLCFGVVQLFNHQVRNISADRAAKGNAGHQQYVAEMAEVADGYGRYTFEKEGKATTRYFVPVASARAKLLGNPALLHGTRPRRDWAGSGTSKKIESWGGLPRPGTAKGVVRKNGAAVLGVPGAARISFDVADDTLALSGRVPSEQVRRAIETAAKETRFGSDVQNKLKVERVPEKGGQALEAAYSLALKTAALISSGTVKWDGSTLSAAGFASDAALPKIAALERGANGVRSSFSVASESAADRCDRDFARALAKNELGFSDATASLKPTAAVAADAVAGIARRCPGTILVELSRASQDPAGPKSRDLHAKRAKAVLLALAEAGVPADRLRAREGTGEPRSPGGATPSKSGGRVALRIDR